MDKISIIITTYNRSEMLQVALDSVIEQSYGSKEIIVVDDCSSDQTKDLLKKYHDKIDKVILNDKNCGVGKNRKKGYDISTGEFVIFMDDDDFYTDVDFFAKAIEIFQREEAHNIGLVASNSFMGYNDAKNLEEKPLNISGILDGKKYLEKFQFEWDKPNSTFSTIFKKKALEQGKIADMKMVNDASIYMRALLTMNAYFMKDYIGVYRIHGNNISTTIKAEFLIENLQEKRYIYREIEENKLFSASKEWWGNQAMFTLGYYVYGTYPKLKDYRKVTRWIKNNSGTDQDLFRRINRLELSLIKHRVVNRFKRA